jgi:hypothetical protein
LTDVLARTAGAIKTALAAAIFLCLFLPLSQCQKFTLIGPIPLPVQRKRNGNSVRL